jgi:hypothetical protein
MIDAQPPETSAAARTMAQRENETVFMKKRSNRRDENKRSWRSNPPLASETIANMRRGSRAVLAPPLGER